jgi:hypothetical protein
MPALHPANVRRKLLDFQRGRVAPEDFGEWVAVAAWDLPPETEAEVVRLLGKTELYLAEYTNGHRSLEELKEVVGNLAARAELVLAPHRKPSRNSTSSIVPVTIFNCAV